jgi:hypothetical protein
VSLTLERPAIPLFVLLLGVYAFFYQGGGWDQNARLDLVRAIAEQGRVSIDDYRDNTRNLACRGSDGRCPGEPAAGADHHYYSDQAPGTSWLAVPVALALDLLEGRPADPASLGRRLYLIRLWTVSLASALAAALLPGLLRRLRIRTGAGIAAALGYGLATLAFPYATLFHGHALAAALLLFSLALLLRARDDPGRPGLDVAAGLLGGAAFAVEVPAAGAVGAFALYAAASRGSFRPALRFAAGAALPVLAVALYHTVAFGGPFTTAYEFSIAPDRARGWMGIGAPDAAAFWELTLGPYRGLFFSAPWLLLAAPGGYHLARSLGARREALLCAAIVVFFFSMNLSLVDWAGGWTLGPRHLVPALPFLAIPAAAGLDWIGGLHTRQRRLLRAVAAALLLQSAILMLAGVAVLPLVPVDIRHPFGEFLLPAFVTGELALNPVGAHGAVYDGSAPPQAWNFGQRLGLRGLWSLAPLLLFVAIASSWLAVAVSRTAKCRPSEPLWP